VRPSGGVVRLLICDDHTVVRVGVRAMLAKEPGFEVVGEASDGEEAVAKARRLSPDVVLMDLRMPRRDGVEAIRQIKADNPGAHILVLTEHDTDGDVLRAVEEGAAGYLLKDDPAAYFYQAVRTAAAGESYMTPRATRRLMERHGPGRSEALSPTELEVLALLARGLDNDRIAQELSASKSTVKAHLQRIFDKLGVSDRTNALIVGLRRGIVKLEP
jgi:DNA-binding NarL/FixJ family response regulator